MKKFRVSLIALSLAAVTGTAGAVTLSNGVVYSANEDNGSVSAITLSTGEVRTVDLPVVPHNVQISPDGKLILAVGPVAEKNEGHGGGAMMNISSHSGTSSAHGEEGGGLVLLDAVEPGELLATLPAGSHPAHVVTSKDGTFAYITNADTDRLSVVDLKKKSIVAETPTGGYPHGLRLSPDGSQLFVANVTDNSVSVIDTQNQKESARIPVGKAPVQVTFTPDGKQVYVSLRDENSVAVIDTGSQKVIDTIKVGRGPIQLFTTPDGSKVYVANEGSAKNPDNTVSVIDTGTRKFAFVTNNKADTVSAIDTNTQEVVATYDVGPNPNGITYRAIP